MHLKTTVPRHSSRRLKMKFSLTAQAEGFLDEITFLYPSGKEVHAFSLWETAEHARHTTWNVSEVTKILASVVEGRPVQTYEVLNSTIQRLSLP